MESLLIKSANQNGVGRGFAGSWFRMPREFLPDSCWTDTYSWPCGQLLSWFPQTTRGWACQYSRSKPFRSTLYRSPCPSTPPTSCMAKPSLPTAASKAHSPSEGVEVDPKGLQGTRRYEASYNSGGCGQQEWCHCLGEVAALQCTLPEGTSLVRTQLVLSYPGQQTAEGGGGSSYHHPPLQEGQG